CNFEPLSSTTSRCSITDDAATLLLSTSVLSSLKGGGLRQAEDPVNPLQPSPILSTKPGQLHSSPFQTASAAASRRLAEPPPSPAVPAVPPASAHRRLRRPSSRCRAPKRPVPAVAVLQSRGS